MARHKHHAADAGRGGCPRRFGDPFNGKRRALGTPRALFQHAHGRQIRIEQIEIGNLAGKLLAIGDSRERIFRCCLGHGDGTFGEFGRLGLDVVRRHDRLTAPDESAQPNIVAFGALGFLNRAIAHLHRNRDRAHGERIGGVCAGSARGRDESFGKVGQRGLVEERGH